MCIYTRSNFLAYLSPFVTILQGHGKFKIVTKLSLKFCLAKCSQYLISCFCTWGPVVYVYLLYDLWLIVTPFGFCNPLECALNFRRLLLSQKQFSSPVIKGTLMFLFGLPF